ncbi:iron-containing redox enzyme family protein [uncultured Nocardioides sp.]|uniref:iron-containing redox enzyme family protein n=1 Tax=uncultured Nocardioides sp. TaxID=198441 RepID=UPI00260B913E|nr:iron-containing redox enzyme family protein [uncultured Nocardioides sp.]
MRLPAARGAVGARLHDLLLSDPGDRLVRGADDAVRAVGEDPDDDALSLWTVQELGYRGFEEVDDAWEHHPALTPLTHALESELEARLRQRYDAARADLPASTGDVAADLFALAETHDGPSLARHVERHATRDEVTELLRQRSVYHLKEADPTAWVIPRLDAAPKAALVQVQYDEYGTGRPEAVHHALFERGMADAGLDASYGAHVGEAWLETLEQNTTMGLFGRHRRLRGAALGHFAAFETTSSLPSRRLARGMRRLGFPESLAAYYDEHVEADAVHEQLAVREVCGALVAAEPDQAESVMFGAWTCLDLESRNAAATLQRWGRGEAAA